MPFQFNLGRIALLIGVGADPCLCARKLAKMISEERSGGFPVPAVAEADALLLPVLVLPEAVLVSSLFSFTCRAPDVPGLT
jgi:hypothetical protein